MRAEKRYTSTDREQPRRVHRRDLLDTLRPMQHYLIAKYVDDIRRNEPVNVGVVVFGDGHVAARFEGEDDQGRLDKRRIRKRVSGRDAYVAWVQHWRRLVANRDEESLVQASSSDFYLEPGGRSCST